MRKIYSDPIFSTSLPGGHCEREPPDPIPNSEVKLLSADDSVGLPHVKVGHRQVLIPKTLYSKEYRVFSYLKVFTTYGAVTHKLASFPARDISTSLHHPRPLRH